MFYLYHAPVRIASSSGRSASKAAKASCKHSGDLTLAGDMNALESCIVHLES